MKKILAMMIIVIVSISACGQSDNSKETGSNKNTEYHTEVSEKEDDAGNQALKESKPEDFIYATNGMTPFIAGYKGDAEIITIPTSYEGVEYKVVNWDAIYAVDGRENLSNIKKIIIPEGIEIFTCDVAWEFTNLESISFPSTLVETEHQEICFDICGGPKVTEVIFPDEPISGYYMEDDAIYKKIVYEKTTERHEVGTEGKILHLYFGKDNEFTIPEDVTEVSEGAFARASLKKLTVKGELTSLGILGIRTLEELILSDDAKYIALGRNSLANCDSLKSIYIGKTTEIYDDGGFHYLPLLEKISVSEENENLFSVDNILYYRNNETGEVTIKSYPAGKTEEKFTLGDEVRYVGAFAFSADDDLKRLYVSSSLKEYIDDMDFDDRRERFAEGLEIIVK